MTLSPTALALVISAAFFHAVWNLALKRIGKSSLGFVGLIALIETFIWLPIAAFASDLTSILSMKGAVSVFVSAILHIAYFWLLTNSYGKSDLGVAYPIARATGPLLSSLFAIWVLMERPHAHELTGALAILVGALVVGFSHKQRLHLDQWWKEIRTALLCGLTIASYTVWDQQSVAAWGLPVLSFYWGQLFARALLCAPWTIQEKDTLQTLIRKHWASIIAIAFLSPLAYQLVLIAMKTAPLSLIAPLRETSILFAILLGALFLKETNTLQRMIGALFMLVGILLITLPATL